MCYVFLFFFFNVTATTEIYTLSLHDALPIWCDVGCVWCDVKESWEAGDHPDTSLETLLKGVNDTATDFVVITGDRKSTRLNSSHVRISYAVFCLKKKKKKKQNHK